MELVLSLFPGAGLLDRSFSELGFAVVSGPDLVMGGDVRTLHVPAGRFDGVIGGPPCQGFSSANRHRLDDTHSSVVNSRAMVGEFLRVVDQARPTWFVMENVPNVPDVVLDGYIVQRLQITDRECGGVQIRNRHIQFGHKHGHIIRPNRAVKCRQKTPGKTAGAITTKPNSRHVTFADQCRKQGLDKPLELPGLSREAKFRLVGNGVSISVGRVLAAAVRCAGPRTQADCPCGCGRTLTGNQKAATATCRKWLQFDRERIRPSITYADGHHAFSPKRDLAACDRARLSGDPVSECVGPTDSVSPLDESMPPLHESLPGQLDLFKVKPCNCEGVMHRCDDAKLLEFLAEGKYPGGKGAGAN